MRTKKAVFVAALASALTLAGGLGAHQIEHANLKIVHPWTREPATGVTDITVAMTIHNRGSTSDRLVSATSPLAKQARVVAPGGSIEIPAGGSVKLSSSGDHLRLEGLSEPLTGYETFPVWLTFSGAGRIEIEVMVEEAETPAAPAEPRSGTSTTSPHTHGDHK